MDTIYAPNQPTGDRVLTVRLSHKVVNDFRLYNIWPKADEQMQPEAENSKATKESTQQNILHDCGVHKSDKLRVCLDRLKSDEIARYSLGFVEDERSPQNAANSKKTNQMIGKSQKIDGPLKVDPKSSKQLRSKK